MKANTTYHMRAKVEYDDGGITAGTDQTFTAGEVPTGIPSMTVTATPGMTPQPGVELVNPVSPHYQAPFATDLQGNVIWTYNAPETQLAGELIYPVKLLPDGHFMCFDGNELIHRRLFAKSAGNRPVSSVSSIWPEIRCASFPSMILNTKLAAANFNLKLEVFSHDFTLLPNGHVLVIANTTKQFTDLPGYPGTTTVIGDVVVDLDQDFNPVWLWNEFDHLDVNRHPMNFPDWTHSNAIAYSPDDGNFLVSIRHQHWIVKVDYRDGAGTGNVLWRLGNGGDFILQNGTNPDDWFYAQHDMNFVSSNTTGSFQLAIMDNGNNRVFSSGLTCGAANAPACYTTIPVMQVDENAKTASFLFHQKLPARSLQLLRRRHARSAQHECRIQPRRRGRGNIVCLRSDSNRSAADGLGNAPHEREYVSGLSHAQPLSRRPVVIGQPDSIDPPSCSNRCISRKVTAQLQMMILKAGQPWLPCHVFGSLSHDSEIILASRNLPA